MTSTDAVFATTGAAGYIDRYANTLEILLKLLPWLHGEDGEEPEPEVLLWPRRQCSPIRVSPPHTSFYSGVHMYSYPSYPSVASRCTRMRVRCEKAKRFTHVAHRLPGWGVLRQVFVTNHGCHTVGWVVRLFATPHGRYCVVQACSYQQQHEWPVLMSIDDILAVIP